MKSKNIKIKLLKINVKKRILKVVKEKKDILFLGEE